MITTVMMFYEVVSRSFFHTPTSWATEIINLCSYWSCFLGSAYAVRTYSHITVDLLINNVNDRLKTVLAYISNALGLLFSVIFTIYCFLHVIKDLRIGGYIFVLVTRSYVLTGISSSVGGALLCIAFIMQIIDGGIHRGGENI